MHLARRRSLVRRPGRTSSRLAAGLAATGLVASVVTAVPAAARPVPDGGRPACSSGTVSLTFDDGPSPKQTPRLVAILRRAGVPATFFMVGQRVAAAPAVARQVETAGFLVANHSYGHADMTRQSSAAVRGTLRATDRRMRGTGLHPTGLMRPPYGAINARVRADIAATGHVPVLWDIDSRDWTGLSSAAIATRVLGGLRRHRSNVVLQHDGVGNSPASVDAVPRIVSEARRRGYCFVALDEAGNPGFPTPRADLSVVSGREGDTATVTVTLDKPAGRATQVRLRVRGRTARPGKDYTRPATRLVVPAGRLSTTVTVPLLRDRLDEATERADVVIDRPVGVRLGRDRRVLKIVDRNGEPGIAGIDRSVQEPAEGSVTVPVRFRLGKISGRDVRIRVRSQVGTATPGEDLDAVDLTVTIPAGSRTALVPVTVHADALDEPEERLKLRIVDARYARVLRHAVLTITPPPPPPPEPEPEPEPKQKRKPNQEPKRDRGQEEQRQEQPAPGPAPQLEPSPAPAPEPEPEPDPEPDPEL